jgi:hypothetical protein
MATLAANHAAVASNSRRCSFIAYLTGARPWQVNLAGRHLFRVAGDKTRRLPKAKHRPVSRLYSYYSGLYSHPAPNTEGCLYSIFRCGAGSGGRGCASLEMQRRGPAAQAALRSGSPAGGHQRWVKKLSAHRGRRGASLKHRARDTRERRTCGKLRISTGLDAARRRGPRVRSFKSAQLRANLRRPDPGVPCPLIFEGRATSRMRLRTGALKHAFVQPFLLINSDSYRSAQ